MEDVMHSGTMGMKWGRRLYQNKDGSLTPLGRIRYRKKTKSSASSEKAPEGRKIRKRRLSQVSDAELKKMVSRLQLENNYIDAYKKRYPESKTKRKALNFVSNIAGESVKKYVNAKVTAALNEKFGT